MSASAIYHSFTPLELDRCREGRLWGSILKTYPNSRSMSACPVSNRSYPRSLASLTSTNDSWVKASGNYSPRLRQFERTGQSGRKTMRYHVLVKTWRKRVWRMFALSVPVAWCACAAALNPAPHIRQYAHTARTVRDGFPPGNTGNNVPIRLPLIEGNDIRFTHYSTEQGLSQSRVSYILQDDQGFMWFGTYNGLNRYDGYNFKVYKPEANNPNSLGGVFITVLFKDRSGVLWIGVDEGLDRFDPVTQTFTHFRSNPNDPASLAGHLEHITQDRDGILWLATRNGLDRLDPVSRRFTHYRNDPNNPRSLSSNDVRFVLEDKQGTLWVATATGLNAFDRRAGNVTRYYPSFQETPLDRIFEDSSGVLWVSST